MLDGFSKLELALLNSWCKETTKDWRPENPSWGHCAVTALVVQDFYQGEIVWAQAVLPNGQKESHYFNKRDGQEIDLTRQQFPEGTSIPQGKTKLEGMKNGKSHGPFPTTRDYILSYEDTRQRYETLKTKVLHFLLSYKE